MIPDTVRYWVFAAHLLQDPGPFDVTQGLSFPTTSPLPRPPRAVVRSFAVVSFPSACLPLFRNNHLLSCLRFLALAIAFLLVSRSTAPNAKP